MVSEAANEAEEVVGLQAVCEEIEDLTVQILNTTHELDEQSKVLSRLMKSGYMGIAEARVMSSKRMQISPSEYNLNMKATARVLVEEEENEEDNEEELPPAFLFPPTPSPSTPASSIITPNLTTLRKRGAAATQGADQPHASDQDYEREQEEAKARAAVARAKARVRARGKVKEDKDSDGEDGFYEDDDDEEEEEEHDLYNAFDEGNPINWFCAMPPPPLRRGQADFREALEVCERMGALKMNLTTMLDRLDSLNKQRCALGAA